MIETDAKGMPLIVEIDGRRYVRCAERIAGRHEHAERCGALIDVTDRQIRVAMDCGKPENHAADQPVLGID